MTTKNAEYRKRLRQVFKAAKLYLASNEEEFHQMNPRTKEFICIAIDQACRNGHFHRLAADDAQDLIMLRIDGSGSARTWLHHRVGHEEVETAGRTAVQQWRHRWLDSLIEEFSK